MTSTQSLAVWELCRQGFALNADEAEQCWEHGDAYMPQEQLELSRESVRLIECANWEMRSESPIG